jgi:integrase
MSGPTPRTPKYRLHKGSGQALVQLNGRRFYLGRHGTPESRERYYRLLAEWLASGRAPDQSPCSSPGETSSPADKPTPLTISELVLAYWRHAKTYYVKHGQVTGELDNLRGALRFLLQLYAHAPAAEFGPRALILVRQTMIEAGLARRSINGRISRIKRLFRWASEQELVPAVTYHGLLAVKGLQRGRSPARETEPVCTVPDEHVQATLPHLTPQVQAMVQVQELAGMRPQDVRNLRTGDLDTTGDVWVFTPWTHKTEHHGHLRRIAIGPRAQAILRHFLKPENPSAYVFAPREAVTALRAQRAALRKTKRTPSELRRPRATRPRRAPRERYTKAGYEGAVARASRKAGVPRWSPNQLRHNCATRVRRLYGLDGAAAVLGHKLGLVTEVYAEADLTKAIAIMREIG